MDIKAKELKRRMLDLLSIKTLKLEEVYENNTLEEIITYNNILEMINQNNGGKIIDGFIAGITGFTNENLSYLFSEVTLGRNDMGKNISVHNIQNYNNILKDEVVKDKISLFDKVWIKLYNKWLKELLNKYCNKKGDIQWKKLIKRIPI